MANPLMNRQWEGLTSGDFLYHPRLGECEFYKYNDKDDVVEVFDKWGIRRNLSTKEVKECLVKSNDRT